MLFIEGLHSRKRPFGFWVDDIIGSIAIISLCSFNEMWANQTLKWNSIYFINTYIFIKYLYDLHTDIKDVSNVWIEIERALTNHAAQFWYFLIFNFVWISVQKSSRSLNNSLFIWDGISISKYRNSLAVVGSHFVAAPSQFGFLNKNKFN